MDPEHGAEKYMNYGQAAGGDDAALAYQKGIEIMQRELSQLNVRANANVMHV